MKWAELKQIAIVTGMVVWSVLRIAVVAAVLPTLVWLLGGFE